MNAPLTSTRFEVRTDIDILANDIRSDSIATARARQEAKRLGGFVTVYRVEVYGNVIRERMVGTYGGGR